VGGGLEEDAGVGQVAQKEAKADHPSLAGERALLGAGGQAGERQGAE